MAKSKRSSQKKVPWQYYATATIVDNSDLGVSGCQVSFKLKYLKIEALVNCMVRRKYADDIRLFNLVRPVMLVRFGLTETGRNNSDVEIDDQKLITKWETWLFDEGEDDATKKMIIFDDARSYIYNRVRSRGGTVKSEYQQAKVREKVSKFNDSRLRTALAIKEITTKYIKDLPCTFKPKPDGIFKHNTRKHRPGEYVYIYLRIGDCNGGSQRDRQVQMETLPIKYPGLDFICVWDGLEVDRELVNRANAEWPVEKATNGRGCMYISTTDGLDEAKILEIFDRP